MITLILDYVTPIITHIINQSLLSGDFPSLWRKAFVMPLPKIKNPSTFSHFRPISILPFLSKVLEAIVHKQISSYIFKNNFLSTYQSGFRPGHSTTTALLKVTEDLRTGKENSKLTVLILIDFSNAFNAVDHDILLTILYHLGFSSSARGWFSSYLRGRQQVIRVGQIISDWCPLSAGVPQGGILSPLLFSVFINLITPHIRRSYHLYADDLQIYAQAEVAFIDDVIEKLNCDLNCISNWSNRFGIRVNPSKCQAIVVGSSRRLTKIDMK
ncbi:unnamed protein product [Parnassius mnemosyne]|uniref:Reverse transcriptase domain-containing protein n=1 Tax=Parnassius mnemosyne TaxID=213953 RepID=A0AAV1LZA9_9NEOP